MTDTTTVDPDALLGEVMLTPEGKADPYRAVRRDPGARTGLPERARVRRREPVRGLPGPAARRAVRQGRARTGLGAVRPHRAGVAGPLRRVRQAHAVDARPRSAGPHPAAQARGQGVHPEDGGEAPPGDRPAHRRAPRPVRRGGRRDPRAGAPAPDQGHRRDARRAAGRTRRAPAARAGGGGDARDAPVARGDGRRRGRGPRDRRPVRGPDRRTGASTRPTTCCPSSSTSRRRATSSATRSCSRR